MAHDTEEIGRAKRGDRQAFGILVQRYQRRVYATAFRVVGNHSDADDLMQEAFLRAYRALGSFDGRSDFFTWLYRIVVNLALNHLRRVQRHRESSLEDDQLPRGWDQEGAELERQVEAKDLFVRVGRAIDELPPVYKITVLLAVVEELPHQQVAGILGCSEGTVAWRVNQARKLLRQRLAAVLPAAPRRERAEHLEGGAAAEQAPVPGARRAGGRTAGWRRRCSTGWRPATHAWSGSSVICSDVRSRMSSVLDRGTPVEERAAITRHLEGCQACRAELSQLEAVDTALRTVPVPEPPEGYHQSFWSRLNMKIDEQDKEQTKEDKPEDSGLIDIKAMASRDISAQEKVKKREEEAAAASSVAVIPPSVSQPIAITPRTPPKKGSRPVVLAVAVAGVAAIAVVAVMLVGGSKRTLIRAAAEPEAPPPVPAAYAPGAAPAPASQPGTVVAQVSPKEVAKAAGAGDEAEPEKKARSERPRVEDDAKPKAVAAREKEPPKGKEGKEAKPAEPELVKGEPPKAAKSGDALDELLQTGAGPRKEEKKAAESGDENLPETLSQDQIKSGMGGVKGRVTACYEKLNVAGLAKVSVSIAKSGKVTKVVNTGEFKGSPTGECVAEAVRGAVFPRFRGKPLTISYTFLLR